MALTPFDFVAEAGKLMPEFVDPGVLLVVPDSRRPANAMTISWGFLGFAWDRPLCVVMVRPQRYTFDLLARAGVFTVNWMGPGHRQAIARCGSVSGRDVDKIAEQGWTLGQGETLAVPYVAEAAVHIECRTVFRSQITPALAPEIVAQCYPGADFHTLHFGQVMGAFRHNP